MLGFDELITTGLGLGKDIIDRVIPDPKAAEDAKIKLMTLAQTGDLAKLDAIVKLSQSQIDVNKAEALSTNSFAANWRPLIGYICGGVLLSNYIVAPYFSWIAALCGSLARVPTLDAGGVMPILMTLLGFAGARTYEKLQGVEQGK